MEPLHSANSTLNKIDYVLGSAHKNMILRALPFPDTIVTPIESSLPQVMVNRGRFKLHSDKKINYRFKKYVSATSISTFKSFTAVLFRV
jgi:hypothetical protein